MKGFQANIARDMGLKQTLSEQLSLSGFEEPASKDYRIPEEIERFDENIMLVVGRY